jgi:putative peptide zinc metalloprotease protein
MAQPALFLLAFGLVVVSAAFHECGHATACTVGGGRPGRMGAGIYLAWPAFYTDVTDAYRLDRKARLRTDLGGVYFSCLLVLALGGAYGLTRFEPLLLIAFLMQIEVVHQMLPFLRLDGYYVVSDLVGVPDLFKRTGPILKSMVPGRAPEPSVVELKRWVRNVVRLWVLVVVPVLAFNICMILLSFPRLVTTAWDSGARILGGLAHAGPLTIAIDVIQLVFLVIPLVGLGYTFAKLFAQASHRGWTATAGSPAKRALFLLGCAAVVTGLAFAWWPDARYTPYRPGESGTLQNGARALRYVGQGSPLFRSPGAAQLPLPPLPRGLAATRGNADAERTTSSPGDTAPSNAVTQPPAGPGSGPTSTVPPGAGIGSSRPTAAPSPTVSRAPTAPLTPRPTTTPRTTSTPRAPVATSTP